MSGITPRELLERWRVDADRLDRLGQPGATMMRALADELETALRDEDGAVVPIESAVTISGYSRARLTQMVREGTLANLGTPRRIRLRVADLPRKARTARGADPVDDLAAARRAGAGASR